MDVDTHTAIPTFMGTILFVGIVDVPHTGIAGPGDVAYLLFQVGNPDTEIGQFICIFTGQLVEGGFLFRIQLVFLSHETGNDLGQFVTGHVPFAFEGAIRVAFDHALVREVGHSLVSPVVRSYIGKGICSVSGYASGECCHGSDCEDLFHVPAP